VTIDLPIQRPTSTVVAFQNFNEGCLPGLEKVFFKKNVLVFFRFLSFFRFQYTNTRHNYDPEIHEEYLIRI